MNDFNLTLFLGSTTLGLLADYIGGRQRSYWGRIGYAIGLGLAAGAASFLVSRDNTWWVILGVCIIPCGKLLGELVRAIVEPTIARIVGRMAREGDTDYGTSNVIKHGWQYAKETIRAERNRVSHEGLSDQSRVRLRGDLRDDNGMVRPPKHG